MFAPPSSRKRKRGDERLLVGNPFTVQPYISSSFDIPTKISPVVILPRSHIPVSWLAGAASRMFDSPMEVPVLCVPGNVVIVKIEGERQLSAVEKIRENVYVLYRLSTQLRMKDIRRVASQTRHLPNADAGPGMYNIYEEKWWEGVGSIDYPFASSPVPNAALDMGIPKPEVGGPVKNFMSISRPPLSPPPSVIHEDVQPTILEVLGQVQRQYFDTLYLAKTSLAYFSKSTLSRARAICHDLDVMPATRFDELTTFLRKMILPLDKMDLKYRKSLVQSALETKVDDPSVFRPDEEIYVHRWRVSAFQERFVRETDPELKQKLEELRIRETELQIILLLEILALDKDHPPNISSDVVEPSEGKTKGKKGKSKKGKPKGANKTPGTDVHLDLLVDRLCIWYSIGSDSSAEKGELPAKGKDVISEKDHLRHFSVEVIMAFYASKLPEKCASINKKFGGSRSFTTPNPIGTPRQIKAPRDRRTVSKKASSLTRTSSRRVGSRGTTAEPLSLLAAEGTSAPKTVRGGTLNSRSFSKKIVEMDNKPAQKKADEELKGVIKALAKPNRAAAASELVDDAEKRLSKSTGRKPKKVIKPLAVDVYVAATPKKRKKDPLSSNVFDGPKDLAPIQGPLSFHLPSSSSSSEVVTTPPAQRQSRPLAEPLVNDGVVLVTPRKNLFANIQRSVVHRTLQPQVISWTNDDATIFATPQKKLPASPGFWSPAGGVAVAMETPLRIPHRPKQGAVLEIPQQKTGNTSIYDALGWDNEDDDDDE